MREDGIFFMAAAYFLWFPVLFAFFFLPEAALASGFTVSPLKVEFPHGKLIAALNLENTSDTATLVQVEAFRWEQADGKDKLTPTDDIFPAPPIINILPRKTQIIRIALRRPADPDTELCYRLFISEVPDESRRQPGTIGVALRMSFPVFVEPRAKKVDRLQWQAEKTGERQLKLTLVNNGGAHVQVGKVQIYAGGAEKPLLDKVLGDYVLPGQARSWILNLEGPAPSDTVLLKTQIGRKNAEARLAIGPESASAPKQRGR